MVPPNLDSQNLGFETDISLGPSLRGLFAISWEGLVFTDGLGICHHINPIAAAITGLDSAIPPRSYNLHQFLGVAQDPAWQTWQNSHPLLTGDNHSLPQSQPDRYQALLETQTEMVVRFLLDSTFTYVNPAYCQMIGKPAAEILGQHFFAVIPPDTQAMMREDPQAMNTLTPKYPFRTVINPSIGHDSS